jgi:hypothetical protein
MKILSIISTMSSHWLVIAVFSPSLRALDAIGMPFLGGQ